MYFVVNLRFVFEKYLTDAHVYKIVMFMTEVVPTDILQIEAKLKVSII